MSLNPELIPVKKDNETIRKDVLTNLIKMLNEKFSGFHSRNTRCKIYKNLSKLIKIN